MHERLEHIKETLMCAVEMQLCDLEEADTKELGEAIDMIKDLEEAIYYCTVTKAMQGNDMEMEWEMKKDGHHQEENGDSRMYYDGSRYPKMYANNDRRRRADGTFYMDNGHMPQNDEYMYSDGMNYMDGEPHDVRDGHSYKSRRMYMEAKEHKKDKAVQLRELEKYMQELSQDVVDMISDASLEEKQYLEKKITALASKIGQMK